MKFLCFVFAVCCFFQGSDCLESSSVNQVGLELRDLHASASQGLGFQACATTTQLKLRVKKRDALSCEQMERREACPTVISRSLHPGLSFKNSLERMPSM